MKQIVKLLLFYFLYQLGCMFVVSAVFYGLYTLVHYVETGEMVIPADNSSFAMPATVTSLLLSNILMGYHLVRNHYLDKDLHSTWSPVSGRILFVLLPLTWGVMWWMNFIMELLDLPDLTADMFLQMKNNLLGVVSIAFVAPVVEEMLFRGAIEGELLRRWHNPSKAIFLSALLFGLVHLNPAQMPYAFCLGLLLGWLYYRTKSIVPGIVLHLVNNGTSVILMLTLPDPSAGLIDLLGITGAGSLAFFGLLFTIGGIRYLHTALSFKLR